MYLPTIVPMIDIIIINYIVKINNVFTIYFMYISDYIVIKSVCDFEITVLIEQNN